MGTVRTLHSGVELGGGDGQAEPTGPHSYADMCSEVLFQRAVKKDIGDNVRLSLSPRGRRPRHRHAPRAAPRDGRTACRCSSSSAPPSGSSPSVLSQKVIRSGQRCLLAQVEVEVLAPVLLARVS